LYLGNVQAGTGDDRVLVTQKRFFFYYGLIVTVCDANKHIASPAFIVAKTISEIIGEFKENPYNEVAIAVGGPHYCPNFNKIQLKSNVAISHVIPQYALPLKEEMVKEAIEKTEEEIDFALLDWKGLGNSEQRQQVLSTLDKFYIRYKKTSEVNKEY